MLGSITDIATSETSHQASQVCYAAPHTQNALQLFGTSDHICLSDTPDSQPSQNISPVPTKGVGENDTHKNCKNDLQVNIPVSFSDTADYDNGVDVIDPYRHQEDIIKTVWPITTMEARKAHPEFCKIYELIKAKASPNFCGAHIPVESGLNCDAWDEALSQYHDNEICQYFRYGWPIGYHKSSPPKSVSDNHPSALQHPEHVKEFIKIELGFKALVGPFEEPPFTPWTRCSPVMTRPKKDSLLRRVIVDLTFPAGEGVNDGINILDYYGKDITYTLPSLGDLVSRLQICGRGALVWKSDLARAYRQLRADPIDTPLLGIKVDGLYYLDLCPPFSCKTSSAACQRMANAVVFLMRQAGFFTLAYLDDFGGCESDHQTATRSYAHFNELTQRLGLQLASHKCLPPTTNIEWLGYSINTNEMSVAVPTSKLLEVVAECHRWEGRKRARKKHIQSLAGRLIYLTNCITPARKFVARILATLRAMGDREWTSLSHDFHLDLLWFIKYAELSNGVFYYTPQRVEIEIRCDSSLTGGGGVSLKYCYSWKYPDQHRNRFPYIHHLEAVNLLVAYSTLAPLVAQPGALLVISTDNISSSFALETGRTRDPVFASCSRELWLKALTHNHLVTIRHKAGALIPMADALSRQHYDHHKAAFVQQEIQRSNLILIYPCLDSYEFFTPGL